MGLAAFENMTTDSCIPLGDQGFLLRRPPWLFGSANTKRNTGIRS